MKNYYLVVALVLFLTFSLSARACHLPAHPSAAAIPIKNTPGMILVDEGKSFFYLVKEGTSAKMKIVWDPAMHNRPGGINVDEYEGVRKAGVDRDEDVDFINGAGFFTIEAMAEFFKVKGDKGNIKEAFQKASGADLTLKYVPDMGQGPSLGLLQFANSGDDTLSVVGGQAPLYTGTPHVPPTYVSGVKVSEGNNLLPSRQWHDSAASIKLENGTEIPGPFFDAGSGVRIKYHDCGIYLDGVDIKVTKLDPEKYIAFIDGANTASKVHVDGIGNSPSEGAPGPDFNMRFTTPTICGNKADSLINIKVEAPPAGFELSNFYWVWIEDRYKSKTKTEPVLDASGTPVLNPDGSPKTTTKSFYEAIGTNIKCSAGLELIVTKPAKIQGFSSYMVYDDAGPLASELSFYDPGTNISFNEAGETTVGFDLKIADTNPFTHIGINSNDYFSGAPPVDVSQSLSKSQIEVFYAYPTYHYASTDAPSFATLDTNGLADLSNPEGKTPTFKSYKHTTQWFWKRAETVVTDVTRIKDTKIGGKTSGGIFNMKGRFTIKNPMPWHEFSDTNHFAVFALARDTSGKPSVLFEGIVNALSANVNNPNPSAKLASAKTYAFNPADGTDIPVGTAANASAIINEAPWGNKAGWQAMKYISNEDIYAPEIQVIVFDTRTNRYHVFGAGEGVAHAMSKSTATNALNDYAGVGVASLPYLTKEATITAAHQFTETTPTETLFDRFLMGANAVSTVTTPGDHGIICQKNTRMLFYARAFDNKGYMNAGGGVTNFSMTLTDKHETKTESTMMKPIEHVFRYENGDLAGGVDKSDAYTLEVTASDGTNSRTLLLNIGVVGRNLEIRTLEERRNRID